MNHMVKTTTSIDGLVTLTEEECNLIYYVVGEALNECLRQRTIWRTSPFRVDEANIATYDALRANTDEKVKGVAIGFLLARVTSSRRAGFGDYWACRASFALRGPERVASPVMAPAPFVRWATCVW